MSFSVKVDKQHIPQLIQDIQEVNNYLLPSFQRRFLWDEDDMVKLFDSIKNGYPIGNIILWKKPEGVELDKIDPLSKPLIGKFKENASSSFLVIDGQQRLTALLLAFNQWRITRRRLDGEETESRSPISFEPNSGRFYKGTTKGRDFSMILRGVVYNDYEAIKEIMQAFSERAYEKVKRVATAFKNYEIPIYVIETSTIDENIVNMLVEAFIRVNKYGERIKSLELILSYIAGRVAGEAKENIMQIFNSYERDFDLDLQPLIRYALAASGIKQSGLSSTDLNRLNKLVRDYRDEITKTLIEKYEDLSKGLKLSYSFLKDELGITSADILPSQITLVPLSVFFYSQRTNSLDQLSRKEMKNMENWLLLVNFTTYYSSKTDSKLQRDIDLMKDASTFPFRELLSNISDFHGRLFITENDLKKGQEVDVTKKDGKPYLFLLYMLLVKNNADDWTGVKISVRKANELATHHIFPTDYIEDNKNRLEFQDEEELEKLINNITNVTRIEKSKNIEIGSTPPSQYLNELDPTILHAHMIPTEETLYDISSYDQFRQERLKMIIDNFKQYYSEIFKPM